MINDSPQRSGGCRAESRPVDGSYCINGSVFSEAFFVGVDALVIIVIDLTALTWSLFEILGAPDCHFIDSFKLSNFATSTAGRTKLRIFW